MKSLRYIKSVVLVLVCMIALTSSNLFAEKVTAQPTNTAVQTVTQTTAATPLSIVNNPHSYLNKKVTITAKFDKFSTLGLDYKPAFKSSDEYISFLVKRDETVHDIPLSELKLFIKREEAEKFIDLKSNDEISITGTVFSDALGDAWFDVSSLKVIKKAPEKDGVK